MAEYKRKQISLRAIKFQNLDLGGVGIFKRWKRKDRKGTRQEWKEKRGERGGRGKRLDVREARRQKKDEQGSQSEYIRVRPSERVIRMEPNKFLIRI
jgi:hypothetical protein